MQLLGQSAKHAVQRWIDLPPGYRERRRRLTNRRFTVVANDCWGAEVYKDLDLPFDTPFIGTFVMAPCFLTICGDAERILRSPLQFVPASRYEEVEQLKRGWRPFPTGTLDDGRVEIQFMHYGSQAEAAAKWARRVERSHFDRLFFKAAGEKDRFTDRELAAFDALPLRKVAFSANPHPELASVVTIPNYDRDGKTMYRLTLPHFDVVDWLNRV